MVFCLIGLGSTSAQTNQSDSPDVCLTSATFPDFSNPQLLPKLGRGINYPDWETGDPVSRADTGILLSLLDLGLTHIRLPVFHADFTALNFHTRQATDYISAMMLEIERLTKMGFVVSVDLHPDGAFNALYSSDADEGYLRLRNIWAFLAARLVKTDPNSVLIELLNEPDVDPGQWHRDSERLAKYLRTWLPNHSFVVGPAGPMRHESLDDFEPFQDTNIVYAIHFYDPFIFTHQGAEWHSEDDPVRHATGVPFPSRGEDPDIVRLVSRLHMAGRTVQADEIRRLLSEPWTEEDIKNAFDLMERWSRFHSVPVIVNEFGVLSYHAPREDRLHWLKTVTQAATERCIGWAHWDFSDGFGLVDRDAKKIDTEALDGMLER